MAYRSGGYVNNGRRTRRRVTAAIRQKRRREIETAWPTYTITNRAMRNEYRYLLEYVYGCPDGHKCDWCRAARRAKLRSKYESLEATEDLDIYDDYYITEMYDPYVYGCPCCGWDFREDWEDFMISPIIADSWKFEETQFETAYWDAYFEKTKLLSLKGNYSEDFSIVARPAWD